MPNLPPSVSMRIWRLLGQVGSALQWIAAIATLAWLQSRDPDCYLSNGAFLQLRLCDEHYLGPQPPAQSFVRLLMIAALFAAGWCLAGTARRRLARIHATTVPNHNT